jgi:hypothetical protein
LAKTEFHKDVELQWKATTDFSELKRVNLNTISAHKIKVEKFTDDRTIKPSTRIGEYSEDKNDIRPVDTKSDVAQFVTDNFKNSLNKAGLDIVDQNPEYILSGSVKDFYVTETGTYEGSAVLRLVLKKGDKVVWTGSAKGTNKRFGRTYKLENYMESLSDSLLDAIFGLLENDDFTKSVK